MTAGDMESAAPTITVLTPTYNRADKLGRLFESLTAQTYRDFEWVVVDDGSVDDTPQLLAGLAAGAPFPVRVFRKENGGRHTAYNLGVREAAGRLCAVIDDDDWYVPTALERLVHHWDRLPDPARFAEVQGHCMRPNGELIGTLFPTDEFDSDGLELAHVHHVRGDKIGIIRTDVLREFPFPEQFLGYTEERIVWNRIASRYRTRGVNEYLAYKEYLPTGISNTQFERHVAMSAQRLLYYEELLAANRRLPLPEQYKAYANLVRNGLHQGRPLRRQAGSVPSKLWWAAAVPAGFALYGRDRRA